MHKILSQFIYSVLFRILGRKACLSLITKYLRYSNVEALSISYELMGIMKYQSFESSGEYFFVKKRLPAIFRNILQDHSPVLFDIGANKGEFAKMLSSTFPQADLHIFEPNPHSFKILQEQMPFTTNANLNNLGLASCSSSSFLYTSTADNTSVHASVYPDILLSLHDKASIMQIEVQMATVDDYCRQHTIDSIEFMKIDTEGNELEVLKGASTMIKANAIKVIQFEFNEMNVISRVFLKDFYDILPGFSFYRLDTDRLIPLHGYSPANEIFQFQNIVAIHPSLAHV